MDDILAYNSNKRVDYYEIIGCDELSTPKQISTEYKTRALECHPDKCSSQESRFVSAERFALLQRAKEVLSDPETRANYDKWRRSGLAMSYDEWCARRQHIHTSLHWAMKAKKEPALEAAPAYGIDECNERVRAVRTVFPIQKVFRFGQVPDIKRL